MCRTPLTGAEQPAAGEQSQRSVWDTNSVENELLFRLGSLQRWAVSPLPRGHSTKRLPDNPSRCCCCSKQCSLFANGRGMTLLAELVSSGRAVPLPHLQAPQVVTYGNIIAVMPVRVIVQQSRFLIPDSS